MGTVNTASSAYPSNDRIVHAAVDWLIRFESNTVTEAEQRAFELWKAADPAHELAWKRVAGLLNDSFAVVRDAGLRAPGQMQAAQRTLLSTRRRKLLRGALVFAGVSGGTALLAERQFAIGQLMADLQTGTGQRQTYALADGSSVQLNARSAVDVDFNQHTRQLRLRAGELIASVAPDSNRPFIVQTTHGMVRALGTRFLVQQRDTLSQVVVLEHSVDLRTSDGQQLRLREGEGAVFDAANVNRISGDASALAAWSDGMLAVENASLAEIITALKPYYSGYIRISPQAAALRTFGVFPLDNPAHTLRTLVHALPLQMQQYGNWLITIDLMSA